MERREIEILAEQLDHASPQEILTVAYSKFDNISFACSFGAEDVVLVDMISKINPGAKVFYLDTDVLFNETYQVRDEVAAKYDVELVRYSPLLTLEQQAEEHGAALWSVDPGSCCNIRKVEPLTRALSTLDAWITGIRRDQAPTRANAKVVEYDAKFGLVKFNPLAAWTIDQVWDYIRVNDVPYNVLHEQGYPSIGCIHCTRAVAAGEDPRAGRWSGFEKTECGLHK